MATSGWALIELGGRDLAVGETKPDGSEWRHAEIGDPSALAEELRRCAAAVRELRDEAVSANLFNDILAPEGYASLFENLAAKIEAAATAPNA